MDKFRASDWRVYEGHVDEARQLCERWHYSRGCSKAAVLVACLYSPLLRSHSQPRHWAQGVAHWLPPAPGPAKWAANTTGCEYAKVVGLSRMAISPEVPKNGASYLLAQSIRMLRDKGYHVAITYADGLEGHDGHVYRASNWIYTGATRSRPRWVDPAGVMRSPKATRNLTVAEMQARGWTKVPGLPKHRFIYPINKRYRKACLALENP